MRPVLVSFIVAWVAFGSRAATAETYPHTAFIAVDVANVWSGPNADFYVTGRLTQGSRVEVHRRDPGGWLAIRPPETSFSWVPAAKLLMTPEANVGEIISDDALSWVGSVVQSVNEHRWQVKLHRGERVEVLGEKKVTDATTGVSTTWYRIAPPSGEFRWVRDQDVSREVVDPTDTFDKPPDVKRNPSASGSFILPTSFTERAPTRMTPSSSPNVNPQFQGPDDVKQLDATRGSPSINHENSTKSQHELELAETELSLIVAKDTDHWDFTNLRQRVTDLADAGQTPLERGRAQLLLEKINQFDTLRRRQVQVERTVAIREQGKSASSSLEPRFDGAGWLMAVPSNRRGSPAFALTDDDGRPLQFVVPAPGVNLHRYTKTKVGIYGQKSRIKGANDKPILTAQRVVSLDRS